ncbi:MAG TPA: L-threonylcarbamoyladenylate synthase [Solirubrobacteraceae bacterium]|jgi:L-threonylcarbamoyladenylate synthase
MTSGLNATDATRLQECVVSGGVAVFPSDTVYGVCCDPENEDAAHRLYELKGRPATRPAALMFFGLEQALAALPDLEPTERAAIAALLPGPVTLLLSNRGRRFASACRSDPATIGVRVPWLPDSLAALSAMPGPVMQTSANLSGEPDARTLEEVPERLRDGADLVLDGGELPGVPSTVIDLRDLAAEGSWHVLREGALAARAVEAALAPSG